MNIEQLARRVMKTGQNAFMEGVESTHCNLADVYAFLREYAKFGKNGRSKRLLGAVEQQINVVDQQFDNGVMQYARPLNDSEKVTAFSLAQSYKG